MASDNSALWESDSLFHALIGAAADGVIVIDRMGTVQVYNPACEKLFGYSAAEVIGRNVKMLMPGPFHAEHDGYLSHYRQTGEKRIIGVGREVVGQRKDLSTFPMYLSVGESRVGEDQCFVGIIHDLTAIKEEASLRAASDRLVNQIVQSSGDAILSKTLDGTITSWNKAAERIFGYSAAEIIGQSIFILVPPERISDEEHILARLRAGEDIQNYETIRRHKNGKTVQVSLSVSPIRDSSGKIVGASKIARDITERKQAEAHTIQLEAELAHVARLSAMGQMSAAIAHELNQPLTAVMNYVKAAQRLLEPQEPTRRQIDTAREAMEKAAGQTIRAGAIIRYLREFVEKREGEKTLEDINRVIEEAATLALVGASHTNVKIHKTLDPALPSVLIDKIQIQQVLVNLIRNSMEAMAATERPVLTLASRPGEAGFVEVIVRDTGPGLPPEVRAKLFQPFQTTKEKGMGIGLNICQSIVEAHGGYIEALLDAQSGAAFRIRLPHRPPPDDAL